MVVEHGRRMSEQLGEDQQLKMLDLVIEHMGGLLRFSAR